MSDSSDLRQLAASLRTLQDAFLESIEPHRAALWRYCYRLTGSPWDADDLVQEAIARAIGRLSTVWQSTARVSVSHRIERVDRRHAQGRCRPTRSRRRGNARRR